MKISLVQMIYLFFLGLKVGASRIRFYFSRFLWFLETASEQHPFVAADWSQLPEDLLQLISEKLNSEFYQLRFRSVCSSWRSSIPKIHYLHLNNLPSKFPIPSNYNDSISFPFSKRTLFLITPPPNHQTLNPWLIKIGPDSQNNRIHLWHPLSRDTKFPFRFPHVIDFNQLSLLNLGQEFVIGDFPSQSSPLSHTSIYMEKVVVFDSDTWHNGKNRYALLTIDVSGKLAIFRCGDERWTIIPEMPSPFDDVCVFKGQPIAVDSVGRAFIVGPDFRLEMVAEGILGGDMKFLVESDGELLLVDKYLSCVENFMLEGDGEGMYEIGAERAVKLNVFRLDEKEKKWVVVRNLGDRVLFLGEDCAFSASCIGNGNCVIFMEDVCRNFHHTELRLSVFHLDQRRISPLSEFPCYSKLFWPPPDWVGLSVDNNKVLLLN